MEDFQALTGLFNFQKILLLLFGFFCLWLLSRLIQFILNKVTSYFPSKRFAVSQASTFSSFLIYLGGTFTLIIIVVDPPKEVIIATAGSLAVAIGFALKDIASSIVAGMVLIFDTPFKVGDRVSFENNYGEIIAIGLRSVKLRTLDDSIVTIPNARFINDVVASSNYGSLDMMVVSSFHLDLNNDIERAKDLIKEVIVTSRFSYLKKDISFNVTEVVLHDKLALRIDAKSYVMDVHYEKAFQSDIITTVNALFQKHQIARS